MTIVAPHTLVLIVDDDVEIRESVADLLRLEGYEVRPIPSADAAWSALRLGARPALIVLDLWIPGMSSGEFVRRLRASEHAKVPVLVLSGSQSADEIASSVEAVSQKPIEATALVRVVDRLVSARGRTAAPRRRPARRSPRPPTRSPSGRTRSAT
jgi:DNA-binding response OmpR family regulator